MKEKRLDFEVLRLIAIFCVVFNHSQERGFELYMVQNVSAVNYFASLLLSIICKVAVPLFFMVSGGLLLHREEPVSVTLRKRVPRVLISLVLFSGILYLFWIRWGYVEPGVLDFLRRLWSEGISAPYWYLYAYLGVMLMLPLLRPMAQHMSDSAFRYMIVLHVIFFGGSATVGALTGWGQINDSLQSMLLVPELFYFLLGYYLVHRFSWEVMDRKKLFALWALAALSVGVMLGLAHLSVLRTGTSGIGYHNGWMLFPVLAVYCTVRMLFAARSIPTRLGKILLTLGSCVFGTYLMEGMLRHAFGPVYEALEPRIHVLPACMIWVVLVVLCGLAMTWVLKQIPVIKKIL